MKVHVHGCRRAVKFQESRVLYLALYFWDDLDQSSQRTSELYETKSKRLPRGELCGQGEPNASSEQ